MKIILGILFICAEQYHLYALTVNSECLLKKIQKQITKIIHKHVANNFWIHSDKIKTHVSCNNLEKSMKEFNQLSQDYGKRYH